MFVNVQVGRYSKIPKLSPSLPKFIGNVVKWDLLAWIDRLQATLLYLPYNRFERVGFGCVPTTKFMARIEVSAPWFLFACQTRHHFRISIQ